MTVVAVAGDDSCSGLLYLVPFSDSLELRLVQLHRCGCQSCLLVIGHQRELSELSELAQLNHTQEDLLCSCLQTPQVIRTPVKQSGT